MVDDGIHNNIEDRGVQGIALCHALVPLEKASKVSAVPGHHGQSVPVCTKKSERPGTNPVSRKNLKAYVPIQGIICLLEVQENLKEDRLPHGRNMLEQLGLEGGGPHSTARPKPVQHIVEHYG